MSSYLKGVQGEKQALKYLKARGMKLLASRVRLGRGELDLVMADGGYTVFVEVKYRPQGRLGEGMEAVTREKRRRMAEAASLFLEANGLYESPARFDVVEITASGLYYLPNAFDFE